MEFPTLGKNCFEKSCKQLDFLPLKCDACSRVFCKDHIQYSKHHCDAAYKKDIQVPVCPLCNKPIPVKRGEPPDVGVSQHIDTDCQSDPAKAKRRVFSNKCSLKGCKQKELVPVLCSSCGQNFCLRHRHATDHECKGFQQSAQAVPRQLHGQEQRGYQHQVAGRAERGAPMSTAHLQAGLSEQEAMSRAIQMSLSEQQTNVDQSITGRQHQDQEAADLALARALQESEREERQRQQRTERARQQQSSQESKCHVS